MSLIRVYTEVSDGVFESLPAKIVSTHGDVFTIQYLSPTENRDQHNRKIYKYESETYEITDESVSEYLDSDMEIDFGFKQISPDEFVKYESDSDDDYIPSESEDESSSSDSDEDEDDESLYTESEYSD
jgi:hypothetical protein